MSVDPGAKHDTGKLPVHSVLVYFPHAIEAIAAVIAHGEKLHGWKTWDTIENPDRRYAEAQLRHEIDICLGKTADKDSGLHPMAHEAWNVLARLELLLRKEQHQ